MANDPYSMSFGPSFGNAGYSSFGGQTGSAQKTGSIPYGYAQQHGQYSASGPGAQNFLYNQAYGQGSNAQTQIQGLKDSGLFGAGGSGNFLETLQSSDPYKALQAKYGQSFDEYYEPVGGKISGLLGGVRDKAQSIVDDPNPSGMNVSSFEQNYAQAANPIHGQMRAMRQSLMDAGTRGGNRSGLSELASLGPQAMGAGALGAAGAQASGQTTRDNQRRAEVNSQVRQQALNTWAGASGQEASLLSQSLGIYGAQQNSAMQAAMAAIMQMLGLQAANAGSYQLGPNGLQVSGKIF